MGKAVGGEGARYPKGVRAGHWTIQLLGGLSAQDGDVVLGRFPSRAERLLLICLALWPRR